MIDVVEAGNKVESREELCCSMNRSSIFPRELLSQKLFVPNVEVVAKLRWTTIGSGAESDAITRGFDCLSISIL
jgi:hypothetical protein